VGAFSYLKTHGKTRRCINGHETTYQQSRYGVSKGTKRRICTLIPRLILSILLILSKFYDLPAGVSSVSSAKRLSTYWSARIFRTSLREFLRKSIFVSFVLFDVFGIKYLCHQWHPCEVIKFRQKSLFLRKNKGNKISVCANSVNICYASS
jgi:hypothetical protein